MWYNGDMGTLSWVTLVLAIATFLLAGAAFLSIRQTRDIQKRERKERKLITIIEWATDITKCETAVPLPQYPTAEIAQSAKGLEEEMAKELGKIIEDTHNKTIFTNLIMRYQSLDTMGKRMVLIVKTLDKQFNCNLEALAQGTAEKLHAHVKLGLRWD